MISFFKKYSLKKSQSSLEFLMIFAIGFIIIVVLGGIFFTYSTESKVGLDRSQIVKIGTELTTNIDKIYFLGSNNMITLNSNFPENIENFTIVHKNISNTQFDYINITYIGEKEITSEIFQTSETYIRINCTLCYHGANTNGNYISYFNRSDYSGGPKKIKITSKGKFVDINFVKE